MGLAAAAAVAVNLTVSMTARATVVVLEASPAVEELVDQALRGAGHRLLATASLVEAVGASVAG
jgi:hypothetical protein